MDFDNQHLRQIAINFGVDVPNKPKSSNWYLKKIKEKLESDTDE